MSHKPKMTLLEELYSRAFDAGYYAACLEKSKEWGEQLGLKDGLITGEASQEYEALMKTAIDMRNAVGLKILARMQPDVPDWVTRIEAIGRAIFHEMSDEDWQQVVAMARAAGLQTSEDDEPYMTHDEWVGAQEQSIVDQIPFGFCPRDSERITVDLEELQSRAHEAWEELLDLAMQNVYTIRDYGSEGDAKRREAAEAKGLPLWCATCGEPVADIFIHEDGE